MEMAWQERTVEIMREEFVKRALSTMTAPTYYKSLYIMPKGSLLEGAGYERQRID